MENCLKFTCQLLTFLIIVQVSLPLVSVLSSELRALFTIATDPCRARHLGGHSCHAAHCSGHSYHPSDAQGPTGRPPAAHWKWPPGSSTAVPTVGLAHGGSQTGAAQWNQGPISMPSSAPPRPSLGGGCLASSNKLLQYSHSPKASTSSSALCQGSSAISTSDHRGWSSRDARYLVKSRAS